MRLGSIFFASGGRRGGGGGCSPGAAQALEEACKKVHCHCGANHVPGLATSNSDIETMDSDNFKQPLPSKVKVSSKYVLSSSHADTCVAREATSRAKASQEERVPLLLR